MRVLATADVHAGIGRYPTPGNPHARLDDVRRVLSNLTLAAHQHDVDLVVLAGDVFDSRNPSPRVQAAVVGVIRELTETCPVVWTPGNHDGMWTIGDPSSHTLAWASAAAIPRLHVPLQMQVLTVGEARVVAMPYPHKRAYDALHPDLDPVERHGRMSRDLEAAIIAAHAQARKGHKGPVIFVSHLTAAGATVGSERAMRPEDDVMVSSTVLDLFDAVLLGHIHKRQRVGTKGMYAGSPLAIDWGEATQDKAFVLAEVEPGRAPTFTEVPTGARPMWDVEGDLDPPTDMEHGRGPLVRLTGTYADRRSAAAAQRLLVPRWYAAGAAHVQWNPQVPREERVAERALPAGTEPLAAVEAYFRSRGQAPEPYLAMARDIMGGNV